jgi:hypothetical protein
MKRAILLASIVLASGVLFTNVYNSVIDATSWGSDIPGSIATARSYFKAIHPGYFFRITTPLIQLVSLVSLIACWRSFRSLRLLLGGAFACFVLTDVMTFSFFYPRNAFMFELAPLTDVAGLTKAWSEWNVINWVRSALFLVGVGLSCVALHRSYGVQPSQREEADRSTAALRRWQPRRDVVRTLVER